MPVSLFLQANFSILTQSKTLVSSRITLRTPSPALLFLSTVFAILLGGCGREITPEQKQADSTLVLARAQLDRGDYRAARKTLTLALTLDLRLNRPLPLGEEYASLGRLSVLSGDFDGAVMQMTKAIEQYKSLTDRANVRKLNLEVASLHRRMGQERVAYAMYTEALRLAAVFHDAEGGREIQLEMIPSCRALGKFDEEARLIDTLLAAYGSPANPAMQARLHYASALSLIERQDYPHATEALLRSLTLADQARDSLFVVTTLSALADVYFRSGSIPQAFETYTDALTRSDRTSRSGDIRSEMLIRVGNIYLGKSQFSEAGRFYRAALNAVVGSGNRLSEGYLFILLGHCGVGNRQSQDAITNIQHAIDIFTADGYLPGLALARASMGLVHQSTGHLNDAVTDLEAAVDQMERSAAPPDGVYADCESVALHHQSCYDLLNELLLKLGRTDDAFWYAQRKAGYSLYGKLSALDLRTRNESINTFLSEFRHARAIRLGAGRQLAALLAGGPDDTMFRDQVLAQINKSGEALESSAAAITAQYPDLAMAVHVDGVTVSDIQKRLVPGTALLCHIPTSQSVYSYAITNSKVNVQLAAVGKDQLLSEAADYISTLRQLEALADSPSVQKSPLEARLQQRSNELYGALIRPVESTLAGATQVLVASDEALPLIPVHALRRGSVRTAYCIEQYPVSYVPSLALLGRHKPPREPVREVVAIGQPGTTAWDVEYELRDIRAFYKDVRLYFGQQASFATWQREHGDVLHLALDFQYSPRSPGNATVILSDAKSRGVEKEKSWGDLLTTPPFPLTIISHLSADSVALDNLLPALFLINGSSTVVCNTAPASRKAKKFFGELFYTGLLAGKSVEAAFRDAQVGMIKDGEYEEPYWWAPFTMWDE